MASARAISTRRRSPPDSAIAGARRRWLIENSASSASSIASRSSGSGSATSRMARMFCSTVRPRKIDGLLRQIADAEPRAAIHRQIGDVLAVELDRAGIGGDQPGDDVKAGRLAGAVRAEQPDHLAALHRDVDVAQHRPALEALAETAPDQAAVVGDRGAAPWPQPGRPGIAAAAPAVGVGMSGSRITARLAPARMRGCRLGARHGAGCRRRRARPDRGRTGPGRAAGGLAGRRCRGIMRLTLLFRSMTPYCPWMTSLPRCDDDVADQRRDAGVAHCRRRNRRGRYSARR